MVGLRSILGDTMGKLIRGLAAEGQLRVMVLDTKDIVTEAQERHLLSLTATAALGRAMTGSLILAAMLLKTPRERVSVRFRGDGDLGGAVVEASPDGTVRGYVQNPAADLPLRADGKLDVGGLVGEGTLEVSRSLANGEIYSSSVPLISGEIAEDYTYYLWQSEQIPSSLLLGVRLDSSGQVEVAGGMAIQALPGVDPAVLDRVEKNLGSLTGITHLLDELGPWGTVERVLDGLEPSMVSLKVLGYPDDYLPLRFACRCSRERALESLAYFSPAERAAMIREDQGAEVVCHWCGEAYQISPDEILSLDEEIRCPDCGELWFRSRTDGLEAVHQDATCSCGRLVQIPSRVRA